jgi:hypothetical protein
MPPSATATAILTTVTKSPLRAGSLIPVENGPTHWVRSCAEGSPIRYREE